MENFQKKGVFTLTVTTEKYPETISKIAGLLARRQFDLKSISIGEKGKDLLKFTLIISGDVRIREQAEKQISKLNEVKSIDTLKKTNTIERETALIRIEGSAFEKQNISDITNRSNGKIISLSGKDLIIEITDKKRKVDKFIRRLSKFKINDISRTGVTAMNRTRS